MHSISCLKLSIRQHQLSDAEFVSCMMAHVTGALSIVAQRIIQVAGGNTPVAWPTSNTVIHSAWGQETCAFLPG